MNFAFHTVLILLTVGLVVAERRHPFVERPLDHYLNLATVLTIVGWLALWNGLNVVFWVKLSVSWTPVMLRWAARP